ncbi:MAG: ATP-dependent DNA ligase [Acidilobaceae archaeon]|nr:ATP-dependent DNA ligase [Acidilobaceae archaeon]MCX8165529.1 ATP-dependent DNA ligase [Acidilobaceae archaeon]MDW7973956.1 ATP-dependent DNA ligase [Sulfolobales archaeon]
MEDLKFEALAKTLQALENISARTQITQMLVQLFLQTPPQVIDKVVYLVQGRLGPEWKEIPELGVGEKYIIKAISIAFGASEEAVSKSFKATGDLGEVAERLASRPRRGLAGLLGEERRELTVSRVYDALVRIAYAIGEGSRDLKIRSLAGLLSDAGPTEAKYLVRLVEGRLRVGVGDATILDALAIAFGGSSELRPQVERAYNLRADLGDVARIIATKGVEELQRVEPQVEIPIRPMLAERGRDAREIMEKVGGRAIAEFKYDGERAQIHKRGDKVIMFSRKLENITLRYPDVVEMARRGIKAREAIVEGEVVAIDPETGDMRPFQELMHRKRKHEIERAVKEVPVKVFLFDALYVDGRDLTLEPLPVRREVLESIVEPSESWEIAKYKVVEEAEEVEKFFLEAVEQGAEGIMVKAIHDKSVYTAGARGWLWVKYKRDYKSEMIDTVDLVVVGAFYGTGKRGGKLSSLLMAAYDPEEDMFKTVCKMATGFTDEELDRMNEMLKDKIIPQRHPRVDSRMKPDVWVVPHYVAEVLGAELTLSPIHTCGLNAVKEGVGVSIRFPRFVRWREDKRPEDATTEGEIVEMYRRQLKKVEEGEQA